MSDGRPAAGARPRAGSGAGRFARAWRGLPHERRLAASAAIGLFVTLFLPWYQETVVALGKSANASLTGWQAFSFVEAAVLLVAAGVLTLLFQRAEGRAFHLPGGDGWVITAAGVWACALVVWRIFDKQSVQIRGPGTAVSGIEWGIFVALAVAGFLAYTGSRIRAAHRPEPPLPGEDSSPAVARGAAGPRPADVGTGRPPGTGRPAGAGRPRPAGASQQPSRRVRPPRPVPADEPPTRQVDDPRPPPAPRRRAVPPDEQLTIPLEQSGTDETAGGRPPVSRLGRLTPAGPARSPRAREPPPAGVPAAATSRG